MKEKSKRKQFPKEYSTWKTIKSRCYSPSQEKRGKYKENNIEVCKEWINSFDNFINDMGKKPDDNYTIERIDNMKGYCKENCKWATWSEQSKNRGSFNRVYTYNGESKVLKDWARHFNIKYSTLIARIDRYNKSFEDAIKDDPFDKKHTINGISKNLKEWCIEYNVDYNLVKSRVNRGWDVSKALSTPVKNKK